MKKIMIMVFPLLCMAANAQIKPGIPSIPANNNPNGLISHQSSIIEDAIGDAFMAVTQSYQIKDKDGEYYGRGNKDEFGETIGICIKVKGGYVVSRATVEPWHNDTHFAKYAADYQPVLFLTNFISLKNDTITDRTFRKSTPNNINDSLAFIVTDNERFGGIGLATDKPTNGKGWYAWLMRNNKTGAMEITVERSDKNILPGTVSNITPPSTILRLQNKPTDLVPIGGVLIYPQTKDLGLVEFVLSGIIVNDGKAWSLVAFKNSLTGKSSPVNAKPDNDDDKPTPASKPADEENKKDNKKKKVKVKNT